MIIMFILTSFFIASSFKNAPLFLLSIDYLNVALIRSMNTIYTRYIPTWCFILEDYDKIKQLNKPLIYLTSAGLICIASSSLYYYIKYTKNNRLKPVGTSDLKEQLVEIHSIKLKNVLLSLLYLNDSHKEKDACNVQIICSNLGKIQKIEVNGFVFKESKKSSLDKVKHYIEIVPIECSGLNLVDIVKACVGYEKIMHVHRLFVYLTIELRSLNRLNAQRSRTNRAISSDELKRRLEKIEKEIIRKHKTDFNFMNALKKQSSIVKYQEKCVNYTIPLDYRKMKLLLLNEMSPAVKTMIEQEEASIECKQIKQYISTIGFMLKKSHIRGLIYSTIGYYTSMLVHYVNKDLKCTKSSRATRDVEPALSQTEKGELNKIIAHIEKSILKTI